MSSYGIENNDGEPGPQKLDNLAKELQEGLLEEELEEDKLVEEIKKVRQGIQLIEDKQIAKAKRQKDYLKKLKHLYSISQLIQKSKQEQLKKLDELSTELKETIAAGANQETNKLLLITKSLVVFDEILGKGIGFGDIFRQYQDQFYEKAPKTMQKVVDAIENYNYAVVLEEMSQLQKVNSTFEVNQLRQLRQTLNSSIDNLIEQTQSSARHILLGDRNNYDKFCALAKNLNKLKNAKTIISNYLDSPTKLDECLERVKKTISRGLSDHLKKIEGMISNHNFFQVDKDITSFDVILDTICNYCNDDVLKKRKQIEDSQEISLQNLKERYEKLNLDEYIIYPPKDIFEKFSKIASANNAYSETQEKLKEIIFSKFRNELKHALEMPVEFSGSMIRNCEFALSCFPENYKLMLSNELENCKSEIASKKNDHERNLDLVIKSKDLLQISIFAKKCKDLNYFYSTKKIEESVFNELNEFKTNLIQASQDHNIKAIISIIKKSFDYKSSFEGTFGESMLGKYESIKHSAWEIITRICSSFQKQLLDLSNSDIVKSEKDLQCFVGIIEFIKENTNKPILAEIFSSAFKTQLDEFNEKVSNYLDKYHKEYVQALDQIDCSKLKSILDIMKIWNPLFNDLKKFFNTTGEFAELNQFIYMINKMKLYPDMLQEVNQHLTTLGTSIVNITLINSKTTESQQKREKYYHELNTEISKLLKVKELEGHLPNFKTENLKKEIKDALKKELVKLNSDVKGLLNNFLKSFGWLLSEEKDFDSKYTNLITFDKFIKEIKIEEAKNYLNIEKMLDNYLNV